MPTYFLSKDANKELENILFYTKIQWGDKQLEKYASQIYEMFDRLLENPDIVIQADYIFGEVRKIPVNRHIIFYQVQSGNIYILRILHSSMDIEEGIF